MYSKEDTALHDICRKDDYKIEQVSPRGTPSFFQALRVNMNYKQTWYLQLTQPLHFNQSLCTFATSCTSSHNKNGD